MINDNHKYIQKYLENIGLIKTEFKSEKYYKYKFPIDLDIYHFIPIETGYVRIGKSLRKSIAIPKKSNDNYIRLGREIMEKENGRKMR